jgi:ribosomal protein L11 methyltransferase
MQQAGWCALILEVEARCLEALSQALLDAGAISVDVTDADAGTPDERPQFAEPGAEPERAWRRNRVTALFHSDADARAAIRSASCAAGLPASTPFRIEHVADRDWVEASRTQFEPVRISPRLWIVPSWHSPPDPQATNILLDPGLAFGTGTHPTTRLALRWLEAHVRGGESVIDFGCGSGILAIAAMKLGAGQAWGVDIDAQALLAARANAVQNRVQVRFCARADEIDHPAELVVANILANPLRVLAPLIARLTAGGGRLALSGILAGQAPEVCAAYSEWFDIDSIEHEEGWALLSGIKR